MAEVPIADQLECARRELRMRLRVYPRRVADRKMSQALADTETRAMQAIITTLEGLDTAGRLL